MKHAIPLIIIVLCATSSRAAEPGTAFSTAPEGALVLFDGSDFSRWTDCDGGTVPWELTAEGMRVVPAKEFKCERIQGIKTRKQFRDFQLHVEFNLPEEQNTNSGIYLLQRYEIQIINAYGEADGKSSCGEIYKQRKPDRNRCFAAGQWQCYDIAFRSPRFKNDTTGQPQKIGNARITVAHNGVVIHNNVEVTAKTGVGFPESPEPGPIMLQDHGSAMQFRNIWILPTLD